MHTVRFHRVLLAVAGLFSAASVANAQFVFGNFEGSQPDNFGSWNGTTVVPFASDTTGSSYSYSSYGATLGSTALVVTNPNNYEQDLAFDFKANNDVSQFLANDVLSFDLTSPPAGTSTAGYWQVYQVFLNGQGAGFSNIATATPAYNQYYFSGFSGSTVTLSFNYDSYKAGLASNPGYLDLILATNVGGGAPQNLYFDNFRLSQVPEPTTLSLLGLGAGGLMIRRRRAAK